MVPAPMMARLSIIALVTIIVAFGLADAAPADWLGSDGCKDCHTSQYEAWQKGPHAAATAALKNDRNRQACLGCHATGEAPAGRALFDGVGCESCHGPGRGYAPDDVMRDPPLRAALGLVSLATRADLERVCRSCHWQELRPKPFDAVAGWKRLGHSNTAPSVEKTP